MPSLTEILEVAKAQQQDFAKFAITAEARMLQRMAENVYDMAVELKRISDQLEVCLIALGGRTNDNKKSR